jgi:hypothetical protein
VKPDVRKLLEVAAMQLMGQIGPALPTSYQQSSAMALGAILLSTSEEFERAAARRVEENTSLRRLFGAASSVVTDSELGARLEQAAASSDGDLAVSALEASNARLRALLIELHAHVEEIESPEARSLDDAIWRELAASTERRKLAFASF